MSTDCDHDARRVLVLAPTGRDATLSVEMLGNAGIPAHACRTPSDMVSEMVLGVGALLMAEEAFEDDCTDLLAVLEEQPPWSTLPLLLMTSDEAGAERLVSSVGARANVTVLQRPARIAMLLSAVRAALRWRDRQYETRDLLERLREADRQKDEFLATVSHELRTPLNAIVGWTAVMESEPCAASSHARGFRVLGRNAAAQKAIIEDLLDMSRIIAGKVRLDMRLVDLGDAAQAAVEGFRPAATSRGITIGGSSASHPVWVHGDVERLQQIAWNLVSNAVKFTPDGGRVTVDVDEDEGMAFLRVADSGSGIEAEFLPYLFERFRQADASTTRRHGGLGLGLAIVRHLVELHGGSVKAESAGTGKGATFVVTLPSGSPTAFQARTEARFEDDASGRTPALDGVRVLVVDDNEEAIEMMKVLVASFGAEVRGAGSADEGLAQVVEWRPDVLISDIAMPGHDGFWLIEQVRSLDRNAGGGTPAVALTALADRDDRTHALAAGYQQHLRKPVSLGELGATVASLAGREWHSS